MTNIIQPSRRGFITGLTSLIVAPAIVRVENIMPVKTIDLFISQYKFTNYHTADAMAYGMIITKKQWIDDMVETKISLTEIYEIKI